MFIDFHGHIYPCFDIKSCIESALLKFPEHKKIIFLTERQDCHYFDNFSSLSERGVIPKISDYGRNFVQFERDLAFLRGRQFASKNGMEVLALGCSPGLKDGGNPEDYCSAIIDCGGLIAFSWAFGKWRSSRSDLIYAACQKFGPQKAILLDSRLRPAQLALPKAILQLQQEGFSLYAGSDPLPLGNHADKLLSFCSQIKDGDFDPSGPDVFVDKLIAEKPGTEVAGSRTDFFNFLRDQICLRMPGT